MTIARVSAHDGVGTTSATFGGTPTTGNTLLCFVNSNSATITISGWTVVVVTSYGFGSSQVTLLSKISAGSEGTITPAAAGGTIEATSVCEYSGLANPVATDGTATGTGSNSNVSTLGTGSLTTVNANDLIFVGIGMNGTMTAPSWTTSTEILTNNAAASSFCGEHIVSTTQSGFSDTAHWTTAREPATCIAAFKAASAPPANTGQFFSMFMKSFPKVPWHRSGLHLPGFADKRLTLA